MAAWGSVQDRTPQRPTFSTAVDLIRLDLSVLDRDRHPVHGLKAPDFTVLEDGKVQPVSAFSEITLPDPEALPATWMRDVSPDVKRNQDTTDYRLILLLMDDAMVPTNPQMIESAKDVARSIIEQLGPRDLAGVVFSRDNRRPQNFTADRERLLAAVSTFKDAGYDLDDNMSYMWSSIGTLQRATEYLGGIHDRRKAIIHITTGLPVGGPVSVTSNLYPIWEAMRDVMLDAGQNGVNIYTIDPAGLDGIRFILERALSQGGLAGAAPEFLRESINTRAQQHREFQQQLASNTGGHAFINTNEFKSGVRQIFRETGSFYLLGYRSANQKADGRYHRLQVKVNRPGVTVVTRAGYWAPRPAGEQTGRPPAPIVDALAGFLPKADLPLALTAAPFGVPGQRASALALVIGVLPAAGTETEALEVVIRAFTPDGVQKNSSSLTARIARAVRTMGTSEVIGRLDLDPGRYEIRVAASTAAGVSGSVYYDVDVPDFSRDPLSLSGVLLTASNAPPSSGLGALAPLLPVTPTTQRIFATTDRVTAFVRAYQGGTSALSSVTVTVRILDDHGATVAEVLRTLTSGQFTDTRSADCQFDVAVAQLKPGPHLLTLEAGMGNTSVRRDVRFEVK